MSAEHHENPVAEDKGKGKAVDPQQQDLGMEEDEDSSEEESGAEEPEGVEEEADDDNMEEIDMDNIISDGRRTRGKNIDFAKAAQDNPEEDDDEDDDEDFEAPDEDEEMQG